MSQLARDLRFALRSLGRSPGFASVAILVLALGIGATGAIFSFVEGIVLSPLPYSEPERLVMVWLDWRGRGGTEREWFTWPDYQDFRAQSAALEELAVVSGWGPTLSGRGDAERLTGAQVSHSMLAVLGVEPEVGRGFAEREEDPGGEPVVVLGHGLWQRLFAGREEAVGATLVLDGAPYTIVGVAPREFQWIGRASLWALIPIEGAPLAARSAYVLQVVGRLRPDAAWPSSLCRMRSSVVNSA